MKKLITVFALTLMVSVANAQTIKPLEAERIADSVRMVSKRETQRLTQLVGQLTMENPSTKELEKLEVIENEIERANDLRGYYINLIWENVEYGDVKIGMTPDQVKQARGISFTRSASSYDNSEIWTFRYPRKITVEFEKEKVTDFIEH